MTDTTTIELKKTTYNRLKHTAQRDVFYDEDGNVVYFVGGKFRRCDSEHLTVVHECLNDLVNRLLDEHDEVEEYVQKYVDDAKGRCVFETVLGREVIANHKFVGDSCTRCGLSLIQRGATRQIRTVSVFE